MKKKFRIRIHPLVLPLFVFYLLNGNGLLFFMMFLFVTLHEMGHCIVAACFGAKIRQITITPIGERAVIKGLEQCCLLKREMVYFSGILVSLCMSILCMVCGNLFFFGFNMMLALFNMMPFLPLDGGNILLHFAGVKYGILRTASVLVKMSKGFGYFLMGVGVLQVILYPYNISLLLIGCYIVYSNQREYLQLTYQTYQALLKDRSTIKQVQQVYTKRDVKLGELVERMHFDKYFFYCCVMSDKIVWKSQKEVMEMLLKKGAEGCVWE